MSNGAVVVLEAFDEELFLAFQCVIEGAFANPNGLEQVAQGSIGIPLFPKNPGGLVVVEF